LAAVKRTPIIFSIIAVIILIQASISFTVIQGTAAQTEVPYENYKQNLPTIRPHPTASPSPLLAPTNPPSPTKNSLPSPQPELIAPSQTPINPMYPGKNLINTIFFLAVFVIALITAVSLKRKFQIMDEND
jgi:hypothetical protein